MTNLTQQLRLVLLICTAFFFSGCGTNNLSQTPTRTRDIVIRDFNKGVSKLDLTEEQKHKWEKVIDSIYTLHDRTDGGWGKYAAKSKPVSFAFPGHHYIITHPNSSASDLVGNYAKLTVEDYNRVIKVHIQIHDRIEEFDDSLDQATRRKFRSHFRDTWVWVYDEMIKKIDKSLDKDIGDTRSFTNKIKLNANQKMVLELQLRRISESRQNAVSVKNQGRNDLWKMMSSPEIPWSKNPMMCKKYFEAYAETLNVYADAVKNIEESLDKDQRNIFIDAISEKYRKEFHMMVGYYS